MAGGIFGKSAAANSILKNNMLHVNLESKQEDFPLMDLHVHRSANLTIEDIVARSREMGVTFGVMQNIRERGGITNDEELQNYYDELAPYPVYVGIQPMYTGWSKNFSPELIAKADYVSMDPQVVPNGNSYGETINVWEYTAYIDNPEAFMEINMKHYMDILTNDDPLDIFACPLFLPIPIQKEYYNMWTKERLERIIDAAYARKAAIEISDSVRVPHEEFILMAKNAGLKFTFGSDSRDQRTGRLDYCKFIAKKCGLTKNDFYIPERQLNI